MNRLIVILIALFSFSTAALGQKQKGDSIIKVSITNLPTKFSIDTLKVQNIEKKEESKAWYMDNNMPWILALVISFAGILVNILISNKQIRATLNTNNRQAWVNETRNAITDLMTQARLLNIEFQERQPNIDRKKMLHEKLTQNRTKLLLLLKPEKETHKVLIDSLRTFINTLDEHLLNSNASVQGINIPFDNMKFTNQSDAVIENGRKLLYDEWGKIQSIV